MGVERREEQEIWGERSDEMGPSKSFFHSYVEKIR